eukprot:GHVS01048140.1.p1 GENE.GHVS01048140.1~~GHVS01048140.1.p1  ORF type:complete len:822 (+),score=195.99 GHVS01048140.1:67-2532(+)
MAQKCFDLLFTSSCCCCLFLLLLSTTPITQITTTTRLLPRTSNYQLSSALQQQTTSIINTNRQQHSNPFPQSPTTTSCFSPSFPSPSGLLSHSHPLTGSSCWLGITSTTTSPSTLPTTTTTTSQLGRIGRRRHSLGFNTNNLVASSRCHNNNNSLTSSLRLTAFNTNKLLPITFGSSPPPSATAASAVGVVGNSCQSTAAVVGSSSYQPICAYVSDMAKWMCKSWSSRVTSGGSGGSMIIKRRLLPLRSITSFSQIIPTTIIKQFLSISQTNKKLLTTYINKFHSLIISLFYFRQTMDLDSFINIISSSSSYLFSPRHNNTVASRVVTDVEIVDGKELLFNLSRGGGDGYRRSCRVGLSAVVIGEVVEKLRKYGITFNFRQPSFWSRTFRSSWVLPAFSAAAIACFYFSGRNDIGNTQIGGFDEAGKDPISFDDILGIDGPKGQVAEIVDMLKNPIKYEIAGGRIPRGVLLVGPPGTGKTMLARAMANCADIPFVYATGSDFVEMFAGRGAQRVRNLFAHAHSMAPAVVFIDEIDSIGKKRSSGSSSSSGNSSRWGGSSEGQNDEEYVQTLNAILSSMDGMSSHTKSNGGVMVIAATNRYHVLDPALTRAGRFDRVVDIRLPDFKGRRNLLEHYAMRCPNVSADIDFNQLADDTQELSPADIELVVNEAAISCVRHGRTHVTQDDFERAILQILARVSAGGQTDYDFTDKQTQTDKENETKDNTNTPTTVPSSSSSSDGTLSTTTTTTTYTNDVSSELNVSLPVGAAGVGSDQKQSIKQTAEPTGSRAEEEVYIQLAGADEAALKTEEGRIEAESSRRQIR